MKMALIPKWLMQYLLDRTVHRFPLLSINAYSLYMSVLTPTPDFVEYIK